MFQCSVYDRSLRFSRAVYGVLILIGFFTKDWRYVLATIVLLAVSTIDLRLNILYDLHHLFVRRVLGKPIPVIQKETAELRYVSGLTGALLLVGFALVYYGKFADFGWIWLLLMSMLLFLACFAGFCIATMSYALLVSLFRKTPRQG